MQSVLGFGQVRTYGHTRAIYALDLSLGGDFANFDLTLLSFEKKAEM